MEGGREGGRVCNAPEGDGEEVTSLREAPLGCFSPRREGGREGGRGEKKG